MTVLTFSSRPTIRTSVALLTLYLLVTATCIPVVSARRLSLRPRTIPRAQQEIASAVREGELLVRFRAGISRR